MKTAIVYYSEHHGNTRKLLDAICEVDKDVTLINVTENSEVDLRDYDRIGFASGIYFSKFAEQVLSFASVNLPEEKPVFQDIRGISDHFQESFEGRQFFRCRYPQKP